MHLRMPIRSLWWKESRQILPLASMLVLIAVILHVIFLLSGKDARQVGQFSVLIGLPGLFAVGAGALVVGQEKETRTMQWLSTLPISPRDLVKVKTLACFAALVVMWVASMGLMLAFTGGKLLPLNSAIEPGLSLATWPLHTLYVMLAGVALAWYFQSSLTALIVLVPVAALPAVCAVFINVVSGGRLASGGTVAPVAGLLIGCQLFFMSVMAWWGWRMGLARLGPASVPRVRPLRQSATQRRGTRASQPQSLFAALCWQHFEQNKAIILCCLAAPAIPVISFLFTPGFNQNAAMLGIAYLVGFLSASWLGVSAFQSDRLHNRIRFLADRGVAPSRVWWSRQFVLGGVVLLGSVVAVFVGSFALLENGATPPTVTDLSIASVFLLAVILLSYSVSQWVAQVASSPIVAAIGGPATAIAALAYLSVAQNELGTPVWILALCGFLPLLTTFALMRRWMDGRLGFRFWLGNASSLAAFVVLPLIPMLLVVATTPSMTREIRNSLLAEYAKAGGSFPAPRELVLAAADFDPRQGETDGEATSPSRSLREQIVFADSLLLKQVEDSAAPLRLGNGVKMFLCSEMILERTKRSTQEGGDDVAISNTSYWGQRYETLFKLTLDVVTGLRKSGRLLDQDDADRLEIALLKELQVAEGLGLLTADTIELAARRLGDRTARNNARRRAVAVSWHKVSERSSFNGDFGGYFLPWYSSSNSMDLIKQKRLSGQFASLLWQYANADVGDPAQIRTEIYELLGSADWLYGFGPNGKYFRGDDVSSFLASPHRNTPAATWHAGWERQAEMLAENRDGRAS